MDLPLALSFIPKVNVYPKIVKELEPVSVPSGALYPQVVPAAWNAKASDGANMFG